MDIIEKDNNVSKQNFLKMKKVGDRLTDEELEKVEGGSLCVSPCPICFMPVGFEFTIVDGVIVATHEIKCACNR